jgi:hypothetical protein
VAPAGGGVGAAGGVDVPLPGVGVGLAGAAAVPAGAVAVAAGAVDDAPVDVLESSEPQPASRVSAASAARERRRTTPPMVGRGRWQSRDSAAVACSMTRRTMIVTVAFGAALLVPSAAHASGCPKLAATVDDPAAIVDHNSKAPDGEAPAGGKLRYPGHFFDATADVVVKVRGNTYRVSEGATFQFSCYAKSKADRHPKPSLDLLQGDVDAETGAAHPGAVLTHEALLDPRRDPTMRFSVSRELTSDDELTLTDKMKWFANVVTQRLGTTVMTTKKSGPIVGVTPYVGPRSGSCRYVHGARLTSKGHDSKGYSIGTATYTP